mmetsp:Transcript_22137/g.48342  ORF Transcript_22137/g.48342 Transcript_22137/m.48342 type:complete len:214 (+) Transcript_22137:1762-2403(+)
MCVRDLASVVALPCRVAERVIRDLGVLVQEHLELPHADAQVILVELIRNVPANRAELAPLLHDGVEEGQAEQQLAELLVLHAALKELGVADGVRGVGAQQTGTQALGRLVCHLDTVLEDGDGEDGAGVGGQPQPEVAIHLALHQLLLRDELQGWQEALGQVAVLQHHPEPVLHTLVNPLLSHGPLPLPQRHALHAYPLVICKLEQCRHRVGAR